MDWDMEPHEVQSHFDPPQSRFESTADYVQRYIETLKDEWHHETCDIEFANSPDAMACKNLAYVVKVPTAGAVNDLYILRVELDSDINVAAISRPVSKIRLLVGSKWSEWHNAEQSVSRVHLQGKWNSHMEFRVSPIATSTWDVEEIHELALTRTRD